MIRLNHRFPVRWVFLALISDSLDNPQKSSNPLAVFKPFQIACQSNSPELITIAVDCLGKLFAYNYWKTASDIQIEIQGRQRDSLEADISSELDYDHDGTSEMITFVIDTICDTFSGETTDEKVELQLIKVFRFFYHWRCKLLLRLRTQHSRCMVLRCCEPLEQPTIFSYCLNQK